MAGADYQQIKARCVGNWLEILESIVPELKDALPKSTRRQPNPGKDPISGEKKAFRFFKDCRVTGGAVVNRAGGIFLPSGFEVIQYVLQCTFTEAYNKVRSYWGEDPVSDEPGTASYNYKSALPRADAPPVDEVPENYRDRPTHVDPAAKPVQRAGASNGPSEEWVRNRLNEAWRAAYPAHHPSAELLRMYLASRGLVLPEGCREIRLHPDLPYMEQDEKSGKYVELWRGPAMLALVRTPSGETVTLHRTWLAPDGSGKLVVPEGYDPKIVMSPLPGMTLSGSCVQLYKPGKLLAVAEGIETAIAAHLLYKVPVWPLLSAAYAKSFMPPAGVEKLIFFTDLDLPKGPELMGEGQRHLTEVGVGLWYMSVAAQRAAEAGIQTSIQPAPGLGDGKKRDFADIWFDHVNAQGAGAGPARGPVTA